MLSASFIAMCITMYINTYQFDPVYFSLIRFYMTCLGISAMSLIMFFAMHKMYRKVRKNTTIILGSVVLFISALALVRIQKSIVGDVLWMKAMIPHHSIDILTSERVEIKDPAVEKLANEAIEAQSRKVQEMNIMIESLENRERVAC